MTVSEVHICFRMQYFHVHQARFMVSAENFMKVLFFTYDFVCSYEHDRVHMACEGFSQYLQPDGGLHLIPDPLHVCGGVPIRQYGPVYQVHRHRCNLGLERQILHVLYTSVQSVPVTSVCGVHIIMDDEAPSFVVSCAAHAAKIPNYSITCNSFYSS